MGLSEAQIEETKERVYSIISGGVEKFFTDTGENPDLEVFKTLIEEARTNWIKDFWRNRLISRTYSELCCMLFVLDNLKGKIDEKQESQTEDTKPADRAESSRPDTRATKQGGAARANNVGKKSSNSGKGGKRAILPVSAS
jgi:hypothetical protein